MEDSTLQCKLQVGGLGDAIRVELKASPPCPYVGGVKESTKQDESTTSNNKQETKQSTITTKTTNNKQQTINNFLTQSPKISRTVKEGSAPPSSKKKKTRNVASEKKKKKEQEIQKKEKTVKQLKGFWTNWAKTRKELHESSSSRVPGAIAPSTARQDQSSQRHNYDVIRAGQRNTPGQISATINPDKSEITTSIQE